VQTQGYSDPHFKKKTRSWRNYQRGICYKKENYWQELTQIQLIDNSIRHQFPNDILKKELFFEGACFIRLRKQIVRVFVGKHSPSSHQNSSNSNF
jgi:hypothetical protein